MRAALNLARADAPGRKRAIPPPSRFGKRRARLALIVPLLCAPFAVRADGAFPNGMSVFAPTAQQLFIGTNFGLVVSEDAGQTFRYACEPYVSGAVENVIVYQLTASGALLAAHPSGISRSADDGCTWTQASGLSGLSIGDVFADPHDPLFALAIAWDPVAKVSGIYPSRDGGLSFGAPLYTEAAFLTGVELSASSAGVIYATVLSSDGSGALLRSADSGASFSRSTLALLAGEQPLILAVDPGDASTVYLRMNAPHGTDRIVITSDAGQTFSEALAGSFPLTGFVRASDGTLYAGTSHGDLYTRAPGAAAFGRSSGPHFLCLARRGNDLLACGDGVQDPYNLGVSSDGGRTFSKLMSFEQLQGPLACQQVQTACAADWSYLSRVLAVSTSSSSHCGSAGDSLFALLGLAALLRRKRA